MGFTTQRAGLARICGHYHLERAADGPIRLIRLKFQSLNVSATLGGLVPRHTSARADPTPRASGIAGALGRIGDTRAAQRAMNGGAIAGNSFQLPMNAIGVLAKGKATCDS
jgi:hypothetical protein